MNDQHDSLLQRANDGDAEAQYLLGFNYHQGNDVAQDFALAAEWYRKAADQGYGWAQKNLGDLYSEGKDFAIAAEWYRKAADQGDALAQSNLGDLYSKGKGVIQDFAIAAEWYQKAAEQGHTWVQYSANVDWYQLTAEYYRKAAECYRKAADQGNAWAQSNLGYLYSEGKGVTQNFAIAAEWYRKAADQGDALAQNNLGCLYLEGKDITQDVAIAAKWYRKAADQGNAWAQSNLGDLYSEGKGVILDVAIAAEWYRKAADQGNARAQSNLGYLYSEGNGVTQNFAIAAEWYRKAADQGNAWAQMNLGDLYLEGKKGVIQDFAIAAEWYRKAAEQNFLEAMIGLAYSLDEQKNSKCKEINAWLSRAAANPDLENCKIAKTTIVTFLRKKAEAEAFMPAKVLLAVFIEAKNYLPSGIMPVNLLDEACSNNDIAALYHRGALHQKEQELKLALYCFQRVIDLVKTKESPWMSSFSDLTTILNQVYPIEVKNRLAMFAQEKINAIREQQHQAELIKAEQEKRAALEDLMSMFAHKFRGPLDSIVYNLGHQSDIRLYQQAAFTMRGLLDIFSLISTDAEKLKTRLKKDSQGEGNLQQVFTHALMNLMQQLLTTEGREKIRQHYWAYAVRNQLVPKETTRLDWLDDYEHIEAQLKNQWESEWGELLKNTPNLEQLQHWISEHLAPITVTGFAQESIRFQLYGATHSFLTIVLNELLLNAFKYYDSPERHPVQIEWSAKSGFWLLRLINPSTRTEWRNTKGSGKGHQFLELLAKRIEGRFDQPKLQNSYTAEFFFPYWSFATAE